MVVEGSTGWPGGATRGAVSTGQPFDRWLVIGQYLTVERADSGREKEGTPNLRGANPGLTSDAGFA